MLALFLEHVYNECLTLCLLECYAVVGVDECYFTIKKRLENTTFDILLSTLGHQDLGVQMLRHVSEIFTCNY
jgi:hypothetical protein